MMPMPRQVQAADNDAVALMLDEKGMICDSDGASEALFGYRRSELVWRHISMLLPQLADVELLQNGQINPQLRFLCRLGGRFQGQNRSGERFAGDLFFNDLGTPGAPRLRLIVRRDERR